MPVYNYGTESKALPNHCTDYFGKMCFDFSSRKKTSIGVYFKAQICSKKHIVKVIKQCPHTFYLKKECKGAIFNKLYKQHTLSSKEITSLGAFIAV